MSGVQLCGLPEPQLFRRVADQWPGPEGAAVAKQLHTALWGLIVDAKARNRHPDGSIVTEEEEEAERCDRSTGLYRFFPSFLIKIHEKMGNFCIFLLKIAEKEENRQKAPLYFCPAFCGMLRRHFCSHS